MCACVMSWDEGSSVQASVDEKQVQNLENLGYNPHCSILNKIMGPQFGSKMVHEPLAALNHFSEQKINHFFPVTVKTFN